MRRITITIVIALGISLLSIAVADACGDKLLRMGRGARFQRSMHPATVLIYLPAITSAGTSTKAPQLQAFLKKAGHRSSIVQGADQLSRVLSSGRFDVVLAGLAEVPGVQKEIEAAVSKPAVVPMIFNGTKADVAAAKKHYHCVVKNPNNGDEYLDAIEEVMRSRMRVAQKKA
jgi:hypothetical protein